MSLSRMPLRIGVVATLCLAPLAVAACGGTQAITQTEFERQASDGASIFSAAAVTLSFVHAEPADMTVEYGQGSMVNYDDQVSTLPDDLRAAQGAPDQATVDELANLSQAAIDAIQNPCLTPDCDWQSQVVALEAARDALLESVE